MANLQIYFAELKIQNLVNKFKISMSKFFTLLLQKYSEIYVFFNEIIIKMWIALKKNNIKEYIKNTYWYLNSDFSK